MRKLATPHGWRADFLPEQRAARLTPTDVIKEEFKLFCNLISLSLLKTVV
jgi:hypothetical protein